MARRPLTVEEISFTARGYQQAADKPTIPRRHRSDQTANARHPSRGRLSMNRTNEDKQEDDLVQGPNACQKWRRSFPGKLDSIRRLRYSSGVSKLANKVLV